jgi:hypothetical protein
MNFSSPNLSTTATVAHREDIKYINYPYPEMEYREGDDPTSFRSTTSIFYESIFVKLMLTLDLGKKKGKHGGESERLHLDCSIRDPFIGRDLG